MKRKKKKTNNSNAPWHLHRYTLNQLNCANAVAVAVASCERFLYILYYLYEWWTYLPFDITINSDTKNAALELLCFSNTIDYYHHWGHGQDEKKEKQKTNKKHWKTQLNVLNLYIVSYCEHWTRTALLGGSFLLYFGAKWRNILLI